MKSEEVTEIYDEEARNDEAPRLIEGDPSPSLRLSIVVPMYAEYDNGNVFRLIESLTKQSASPESYEVLCLVNNTYDEYRNGTGRYFENQHTLEIGQYLNGGGTLPERLNEYRKQVLEDAKNAGVAIKMVDFSAGGIERNIGKVRDIGLGEAVARFARNGQGDSGIIAQMDADTVMESGYVEKVLEHFTNPRVETLFVSLDYLTPEGTEDLFRTSFHHQYKIAVDQWINSSRNSSVVVGGPQTVARVGSYKKVGGVVHQDRGSDFRLSEDLSTRTRFEFANDVRVYTSDRARVGGVDAQMRLERMNDDEEFRFNGDLMYQRPRVSFLRRELEAVAKAHPEVFESEELIKAYFEKYAIPFDYAKFKEEVLEKSSKTRDGQERPLSFKIGMYTSPFVESLGVKTSVGSNEYVDDAVTVLKSQITPAEATQLDELVRQNSLRASIRLNQSRTAITEVLALAYKNGNVSPDDFTQTPKIAEFIELNPWIIDKVNALRGLYNRSQEALEDLKKEFPEWVESLENSRLRRATAVLHGLTAFVRGARNNPSKFPGTADFLERVSGKKPIDSGVSFTVGESRDMGILVMGLMDDVGGGGFHSITVESDRFDQVVGIVEADLKERGIGVGIYRPTDLMQAYKYDGEGTKFEDFVNTLPKDATIIFDMRGLDADTARALTRNREYLYSIGHPILFVLEPENLIKLSQHARDLVTYIGPGPYFHG